MKKLSLASYYGGKISHLEALLPLLQRIPHSTYVEPFGGMAGLLLNKRPVKVEVYNDLDDAVVTLFRVVRDRHEELAQAVANTPYARSEYKYCVKAIRRANLSELEKARCTYALLNMTFNATVGSGGFSSVGGNYNGNVAAQMHNTSSFERVAKRLSHVFIECADWLAIMGRWASPKTLFYLDPPYHPDTRSSRGYRLEWSREMHGKLIDALTGFEGLAVLSGYHHADYDALTKTGWQRRSYDSYVMHSGDGVRGKQTESVWCSPAVCRFIEEPSLFSRLT